MFPDPILDGVRVFFVNQFPDYLFPEPFHFGSLNIYKVYMRWCRQNNEKELNSSRLGVKLADRGFKRDKKGGVRGFVGLRLINPVRDEESCETALKVYKTSKSSE